MRSSWTANSRPRTLVLNVLSFPAWDLGTVEAYAVYANGNAIKPAAREFIDFLAHDFRDTPP
jgi:hypothetical protein